MFQSKVRMETINNKQSQLMSGSDDNNEFQKMEKIIEKIEKEKQQEKDRKSDLEKLPVRLRRAQKLDESILREMLKSSEETQIKERERENKLKIKNKKKEVEAESDDEEYYSYYDEEDYDSDTDNNNIQPDFQQPQLQYKQSPLIQGIKNTQKPDVSSGSSNFQGLQLKLISAQHLQQQVASRVTAQKKSTDKINFSENEEQLNVLTSQNTIKRSQNELNKITPKQSQFQVAAEAKSPGLKKRITRRKSLLKNKIKRRQTMMERKYKNKLISEDEDEGEEDKEEENKKKQKEQEDEEILKRLGIMRLENDKFDDDDDKYSHQFSDSQSPNSQHSQSLRQYQFQNKHDANGKSTIQINVCRVDDDSDKQSLNISQTKLSRDQQEQELMNSLLSPKIADSNEIEVTNQKQFNHLGYEQEDDEFNQSRNSKDESFSPDWRDKIYNQQHRNKSVKYQSQMNLNSVQNVQIREFIDKIGETDRIQQLPDEKNNNLKDQTQSDQQVLDRGDLNKLKKNLLKEIQIQPDQQILTKIERSRSLDEFYLRKLKVNRSPKNQQRQSTKNINLVVEPLSKNKISQIINTEYQHQKSLSLLKLQKQSSNLETINEVGKKYLKVDYLSPFTNNSSQSQIRMQQNNHQQLQKDVSQTLSEFKIIPFSLKTKNQVNEIKNEPPLNQEKEKLNLAVKNKKSSSKINKSTALIKSSYKNDLINQEEDYDDEDALSVDSNDAYKDLNKQGLQESKPNFQNQNTLQIRSQLANRSALLDQQQFEIMTGGGDLSNSMLKHRKKKKGKRKKTHVDKRLKNFYPVSQEYYVNTNKLQKLSSSSSESGKSDNTEGVAVDENKNNVWKIDQLKHQGRKNRRKQDDSEYHHNDKSENISPGRTRSPPLTQTHKKSFGNEASRGDQADESDTEEEVDYDEDDDSRMVEKEQTTATVYKLTTTRYAGMLNEEYNLDDLEIMRTNSERNLLNHKIKNIALKKGFMVAVSTLIFIIDSEVTWSNNANYQDVRMIVNVLRAIISTLTTYITFLVIQKHYYSAKVARHRHQLPTEMPLIWNTNELPVFILETAICMIHLPPLIDTYITHLDYSFIFFAFIFLFKLMSCLELLHHYSPLNTSKGRFVGSLSKTQITTSFLVKAWLKSYPIVALPSAIFCFLISNSYLVYVIERNNIPTTCYEDDQINHEYTFKNCFWFCVISFLTVGYGDYYPSSIPGRAVNTVIVIGGMASSATIIGLVHQQMQLSNEEYHVFKFIKTRKKEQLRRRIAAKLVQLLLQMQVQRCKELAKNNIKWKRAPRVIKLRNEIFMTIERWKQINLELYATNRREHNNLSEMNHMRNIEEMLSGIVIKGATIWEQIRTEKLQRQMDVEKSFTRSKLEVAKLESEMHHNKHMSLGNKSMLALQRFKTQRLASLNLSSQQIINHPQSQSFRGNNQMSLFKLALQSKQPSNDILSQSSQFSIKRGLSKKMDVPLINITNLDRSLHKKERQNGKSSPERTPVKSIYENLNKDDSKQTVRLSLVENNYDDDIESEIFTDSEISGEPVTSSGERPVNAGFSDKVVQISHGQDKVQRKQQQTVPRNQNTLYDQDEEDQFEQNQNSGVKRRKKSLKGDQNQRQSMYKRTRTVATTQAGKSNQNIISGVGNLTGLDQILMNRINRQSSNIVNRDFVIEEDFEEDLITPMSRDNKYTRNDFSDAINNNDYQSFQNNHNVTENQSNYMSSILHNQNNYDTNSKHNDEVISKSKSLRSRVKFSDEIPQQITSLFSRQTTTKKATVSVPKNNIQHSKFMKQASRRLKTNDLSYNPLDLSNFKSEKSLINAVNDLKFDRARERNSKLQFERCFPQEATNIQNEFNRTNTRRSVSSNGSNPKKLSATAALRKRRMEYLKSNFEIEKRIQTTTTTKYYQYQRNGKRGQRDRTQQPAGGKQHLFNSDSSSLYGDLSQQIDPYKYDLSPKKRQSNSQNPKSKLKLENRMLKKPTQHFDEEELNTERTAKEFKLFENQRNIHESPFQQKSNQQSSSQKKQLSSNPSSILLKGVNRQPSQEESRFSLRKRSINLKIKIPEKQGSNMEDQISQIQREEFQSPFDFRRLDLINLNMLYQNHNNQNNQVQQQQQQTQQQQYSGQFLLPSQSSQHQLYIQSNNNNSLGYLERQNTNGSGRGGNSVHFQNQPVIYGNTLQAPSNGGQNQPFVGGLGGNANIPNPMSLQTQFGGKSPIKFRKQNTAFSEQSAKEIQNLLEPIGLNSNLIKNNQNNGLNLQYNFNSLNKQPLSLNKIQPITNAAKEDKSFGVNMQDNQKIPINNNFHLMNQLQQQQLQYLQQQNIDPYTQAGNNGQLKDKGIITQYPYLQYLNSQPHFLEENNNRQQNFENIKAQTGKKDSMISYSHNFSNISGSVVNSQQQINKNLLQESQNSKQLRFGGGGVTVKDDKNQNLLQTPQNHNIQQNQRANLNKHPHSQTQLKVQHQQNSLNKFLSVSPLNQESINNIQRALGMSQTSQNQLYPSDQMSQPQSYSGSFQLNLQKVQQDYSDQNRYRDYNYGKQIKIQDNYQLQNHPIIHHQQQQRNKEFIQQTQQFQFDIVNPHQESQYQPFQYQLKDFPQNSLNQKLQFNNQNYNQQVLLNNAQDYQQYQQDFQQIQTQNNEEVENLQRKRSLRKERSSKNLLNQASFAYEKIRNPIIASNLPQNNQLQQNNNSNKVAGKQTTSEQFNRYEAQSKYQQSNLKVSQEIGSLRNNILNEKLTITEAKDNLFSFDRKLEQLKQQIRQKLANNQSLNQSRTSQSVNQEEEKSQQHNKFQQNLKETSVNANEEEPQFQRYNTVVKNSRSNQIQNIKRENYSSNSENSQNDSSFLEK